MFDVIVIGGGPAGVTAALQCRQLGASVALVERGNLGGTCTNDGCAPTRVLAKAARLMRDSEHFDDYGLIGERPTVDFERLLAQTQAIVYSLHEKKQLVEHLTESGVELFVNAGDAAFVDPHRITLVDRTILEGRQFILCVGGHSRRLDFPGAELALTHSDVWQLNKLPRSVVIVGAAATGCQFASIFASFGVNVTMLELMPRILPGEDPDVSRMMDQAFRAHGIAIHTGITGLDRIDRHEQGLRVTYRTGGETRTLDAEAVLLSVGWPGNIERLNLGAAGVVTERSFIKVDDYLRTSAPHIFAAGDITGRMQLVQSANYDARVAAENAVAGARTAYRHQIVPHGGFTDPEYGSVGLPEDQAREQDEVAVAVVPYGDIDRAVIDRRTEGLCKLVVSKTTRRILGAHVVGEQALEVTQLVAAGMVAGMTVEHLANVELAYPTYAAIVGVAARRILCDLDSIVETPQWPTLGKRVTVEWERRERD